MFQQQMLGSQLRRLPALEAFFAAACLLALPRLAAQSADPSLFSGMHWRLIGPYRSGNVSAVAGVPGDPTTFYVGLPEGGVWKTTDAGTTWNPIFDEEDVPSIGSIAVAPSDPQVIYVGTGDPTGWSFTPGRGIYKSSDAGKTWQNVGLEDSRYLTALLVDPHNPAIVLAGAGSRFGRSGGNPACGVYRTTDGGRTWMHVLFIDDRTGVASMAFDYTDPSIVYATFTRPGRGFGAAASAGTTPPTGPVVYKSTDEGATWKPLSQQGLPAGLSSATIAVGAGTHGQRVYLMVGSPRDRGVYRSDDGGATWRLGTTRIASAGGRIYVEPKNPDVVYLMGTSMYRSLDGARTFVSYKGAPGGDDDRALWIDPTHPQWMVMGTDQGPTVSLNGGRTWTPWFNLPNGQFYHIATDNQFPYWVYAAQQDSGTVGIRSRSDFGGIRAQDWYPVGGFEAGYIVVDPLNPRWIFTQGWYHVLRRFDRETGQVVVVYTPSAEDRFDHMPPLAYSPQDPHVLYMGAQYVLTTDDGGVTWKRISPDLTARAAGAQPAATPGPGGRPRPVAIESLALSPVRAGVIWAGTSNGIIEVTQDGGRNWNDVSPSGLDARSAVTIIDASHHDAGTAYAAVEAAENTHPFIYRTTDFGHTWRAIVNGLPDDVRVRSVREDPVSPDLLFAGTEMGARVSFDQGDHWQSLQLNLPSTVVSDLTVHDEDLVISTYGRSLWILDDLEPLRQIAEASAAPVYLYRPEPAFRVRWSNDQDTPLPPEVPRGENPPEGAIIDYHLKNPAPGPVTVSIYDAAGNLVREYSSAPPPADNNSMPNVPEYWFAPPTVLSTARGMHRLAWDLRYPAPKTLTYGYFGGLLDYTEYTLTWHAIVGATPRVQPVGPIALPGTYQIRLSVNGHIYTRELTVKNDPRSLASQADLEAQFEAEQRIVNGLSASYDAYDAIRQMRQTLADDEAKMPQDSSLIAAVKALDKKAAALMAGNSGFGIANRDFARRLQDLDFGDLRPTASDLAAIKQTCRRIQESAAQWDQMRRQDVPALNQMLLAAHLPALTLPADPAVPPCGP